jgi:glycogen phosphorylase
MSDMALRAQFGVLAGNLATLWNGGRDLIDELIGAGGNEWSSPAAALAALSDSELEDRFGGRRSEVDKAVADLNAYLEAETWFDRASRQNDELSSLRRGPVAYFCSEFGLAKWLPIYSGGLGILAGDVLKEASDMGLPFVGVGLLYQHGYFHQKLNAERRQTEYYDSLEPSSLGLERAVDAHGDNLLIAVPMAERTVYAGVWKLQVGRVPLYLLDTNVPQNDREDDREITGTLYGGDQETRIRQEIVLGIGGVRALRALGIHQTVTSMNEGHAAFLGIELLSEILDGGDFQTALRRLRSEVVYTNHTVVPAGNDIFPRDLVQTYLGQYVESRGIGMDHLMRLAAPGDNSGFQMALLAFGFSGRANAVSELHAKIIPREWPGTSVEAVTNGVHVPTWTGPRVQALLNEFVPDWRGDSPNWSAVHDIPAARLHEARAEQRRMMIDYLRERGAGDNLDPKALTLVWARRFAEYKRAWLIGSDLERLSRILNVTDRPVRLVFSGKSHPRDEGGKTMMQNLLQRLDNDGSVSSRVTFVEDYSEEIGRYLTMGADVWLNTPRKPLEASGTSGMKSSDNGGLQVTVTDGWAAEVDWYGVGWGISGSGDEGDARELYDFLENSVVPTFFDRDASGVAQQWAQMMRNTMIVTLSRYSARRMMHDYIEKLYLPLLREQEVAPVALG